MQIKVEYYDQERYNYRTDSGMLIGSTRTVLKKTETWEGEEKELFLRFYNENNKLRYCNGCYYKFKDDSVREEYDKWYDSLGYNEKFMMFYGDGIVD